MFKKIAVVLVIVILATLGYATTRPDSMSVQRTIRIEASPQQIYPLIADLRRWSAWSPYERKDPDMQREFGGAAEGVGAYYAWSGDDTVGAGRMEITAATPPHGVRMRLDFTRPMEISNTTVFALLPEGDATEVSWTMHAPSPYLSKLFGLFVDMDRMIGSDFEAGLAELKAVVEARERS